VLNQISGIEQPQLSLLGVVAVVNGTPVVFSRVRKNVSMLVQVTGGPAACKVVLRATIDGVIFSNPIATFDVTQGNNSGDLLTAGGLSVIGARADLSALSGGTTPVVTVTIIAD
jgi:hypothetical protein